MIPVIFRTWKGEPHTVIAILPTYCANRGKIEMYEHVGQSGEGDYDGVVSRTRLSTPAEYEDLLAELHRMCATEEDVLRVYQRNQRCWQEAREAWTREATP